MKAFMKKMMLLSMMMVMISSYVYAVVILPKGDPADYTDIATHWAYDPIQYVIRQGYFKGLTSHEFVPDGDMSRAMICTVLWRLTGENLTHTKQTEDGNTKVIPNYVNMFWDMKDNDWFTNYVSWANKKEIIDGYSKREFRPNESLTREQLAVILYNYMKNYKVVRGFDKYKVNEPVEFTDQTKISSWALNQVSIMQQIGLMAGREDGSFDPQGTVTRAEVAVIIERLVKML